MNIVHLMNLLGNPGHQLLCFKDHLICVAALHCVPVYQTADAEVVRVWKGGHRQKC